MVPHSNILAWKIPWTEEPGGLQSMGSQRVRHNLATKYRKSSELHPDSVKSKCRNFQLPSFPASQMYPDTVMCCINTTASVDGWVFSDLLCAHLCMPVDMCTAQTFLREQDLNVYTDIFFFLKMPTKENLCTKRYLGYHFVEISHFKDGLFMHLTDIFNPRISQRLSVTCSKNFNMVFSVAQKFKENLKCCMVSCPLHWSQSCSGEMACVTQWSYEPSHSRPPKTDRS